MFKRINLAIFPIALFVVFFVPAMSQAAVTAGIRDVTQTGIPGSVLVSWNRTTNDRYVVVYKKSADPPSSAQWRFQTSLNQPDRLLQIYGLEDGVSWDFQAYPDDGIRAWKNNVPTKSIIPQSINLTIEKLLFVIPQSFTSVDYQQRIADYISDLNFIYSKNTQKRFVLDSIMVYDDTNCTGSDYDSCSIIGNPDYHKPYALPILYIKVRTSNDLPTAGAYPRLSISIPVDTGAGLNLNLHPAFLARANNLYWKSIAILAHELGHSYNIGPPELYWYVGQDNTGVQPIIPSPPFSTSLPERFYKDPMVFQSFFDNSPQFSPLSAAIINKNSATHLDFVFPDTQAQRFYHELPPLQLRLTDTGGLAIANAQVKVYCIRDYYRVDGGSRLIQQTTTDINGMASLTGPQTLQSASGCLVEAIKVYDSLGRSKAVSITAAELQEAKIVNNLNTYIQAVVLEEPDTTIPIVSITSPSFGSTNLVFDIITVQASASDNIGVIGVQFKLDGANLGAEDTTAPYLVSWDTTTVANGAHTLTAVAMDAAGNQANSASVTVTVANIVPSTKFQINDRVKTTQNLNVRSLPSASANLLGTQPTGAKGTVIGGPATTDGFNWWWQIDYDVAPDGWSVEDYLVKVIADIQPPSVAIISPISGATVSGIITVSASASDNVGVSGVQFKLDGVNLETEDTIAPYSILWDTTTSVNGSHALTAVVRDAAGNTATASPVTVMVSNLAPPPPSAKFSIGDRVQVSSGPLNVRSFPSTSGTILGAQSTGAQGTVIGGPIAADGFNWWQIDYDTAPDGWSVEDYLTDVVLPPPPPPPGETPLLLDQSQKIYGTVLGQGGKDFAPAGYLTCGIQSGSFDNKGTIKANRAIYCPLTQAAIDSGAQRTGTTYWRDNANNGGVVSCDVQQKDVITGVLYAKDEQIDEGNCERLAGVNMGGGSGKITATQTFTDYMCPENSVVFAGNNAPDKNDSWNSFYCVELISAVAPPLPEAALDVSQNVYDLSGAQTSADGLIMNTGDTGSSFTLGSTEGMPCRPTVGWIEVNRCPPGSFVAGVTDLNDPNSEVKQWSFQIDTSLLASSPGSENSVAAKRPKAQSGVARAATLVTYEGQIIITGIAGAGSFIAQGEDREEILVRYTVDTSPTAPPTANLTLNVTRGGSPVSCPAPYTNCAFQVGDSFVLKLATTNFESRPFKLCSNWSGRATNPTCTGAITTNPSGGFTWTGTWSNSDVGSWSELVELLDVDGNVIVPSNTLSFTINPVSGPSLPTASLSINRNSFVSGDSFTLSLSTSPSVGLGKRVDLCSTFTPGAGSTGLPHTDRCTGQSGNYVNTNGGGGYVWTGSFTQEHIGVWTEWTRVEVSSGQWVKSNDVAFTVNRVPVQPPITTGARLTLSPSTMNLNKLTNPQGDFGLTFSGVGAGISANGGTGEIAVGVGATVAYRWSSYNAESGKAFLQIKNGSGGNIPEDLCGNRSGEWSPAPISGTWINGGVSGTAAPCQAGYIYEITYRAENTAGTPGNTSDDQSNSGKVTVKVNQFSPPALAISVTRGGSPVSCPAPYTNCSFQIGDSFMLNLAAPGRPNKSFQICSIHSGVTNPCVNSLVSGVPITTDANGNWSFSGTWTNSADAGSWEEWMNLIDSSGNPVPDATGSNHISFNLSAPTPTAANLTINGATGGSFNFGSSFNLVMTTSPSVGGGKLIKLCSTFTPGTGSTGPAHSDRCTGFDQGPTLSNGSYSWSGAFNSADVIGSWTEWIYVQTAGGDVRSNNVNFTVAAPTPTASFTINGATNLGTVALPSSYNLSLASNQPGKTVYLCSTRNGVVNPCANFGTTNASGGWSLSGPWNTTTCGSGYSACTGGWTEWVQIKDSSGNIIVTSNNVSFTLSAPSGLIGQENLLATAAGGPWSFFSNLFSPFVDVIRAEFIAPTITLCSGGSCPQKPPGGTLAFTSGNPSVAGIDQNGRVSAAAGGNSTIIATFDPDGSGPIAPLAANAAVNVSGAPPPPPPCSQPPCSSPELGVSLSASPSSGQAPLNNVDLTASVSGSAAGSIRYRFDCENDGTYERDIISNSNPYTAADLCNYPSAGFHTAAVRVDRGGFSATDTVTIDANAPGSSLELVFVPSSITIYQGEGTSYSTAISQCSGSWVSGPYINSGEHRNANYQWRNPDEGPGGLRCDNGIGRGVMYLDVTTDDTTETGTKTLMVCITGGGFDCASAELTVNALGPAAANLDVRVSGTSNWRNSVTVGPSQHIDYQWSGSGGTFYSFFLNSVSPAGNSCFPSYLLPWTFSNSASGQRLNYGIVTTNIRPCEAGYTYTFAYRVFGPGNVVRAQDSVTVTVTASSTTPTPPAPGKRKEIPPP